MDEQPITGLGQLQVGDRLFCVRVSRMWEAKSDGRVTAAHLSEFPDSLQVHLTRKM